MNEFLESLEIGEDKVKLPKEVIKSILAEHGKAIKTETEKVKTELNKTITDLKEEIEKSPKSEEIEKLKQKITTYEEQENQRKAQEEDKLLTNNILEVFGDKKFTSEYAKNGLLADIKVELNKPENKGKGISDIFNSLTKDKTDIFANPNTLQDMPAMGESEQVKESKILPMMF